MTSNITILEKLRASSVYRWHIVNTSKQQTVGEHSFNVALIAMDLCERLGKPEWVPRVTVLALEHDIDEVFTGDMPSSAKERKPWPMALEPETIIKVADFIEAYVFIDEYRVDRYGDQVFVWMDKRYADMMKCYSLYWPNLVIVVAPLVAELFNGTYRLNGQD